MGIQQVVRLVISGSIGGLVTWNNAFHVATDTAGVGPGLNCHDLAFNFDLQFITNGGGFGGAGGWWRREVGASVIFNNVSAQRVYPDTLDAAVIGSGGAVGLANALPGGVSGVTLWPNLPAPCAGITTWKTGHPGRSGRGRTYWAGIPYGISMTTSECVAPGTVARTHIDNIAKRLCPILQDLGGSPIAGAWYLCVVSPKLAGKIPPISLAGVFPTIGYSNPNYWATMGSRRGGHGI